MSITVIEPATSTDLTVKETIQTQLGLAVGTDDEIFDQLIAAASDFIVDYTQRKFARERWEELVPGYNTNWLQVSLTPINSINSIMVDNTTITDFIIEDPDAGLIFREVGWQTSQSFHKAIVRHPLTRSELPRFKVNYYGGYVLPSFATGTIDLPNSINQACVDLVRTWYGKVKDNIGDDVKQIKIGDYAISYDTIGAGSEDPNALGIPPTVLAKIRSYRRVV